MLLMNPCTHDTRVMKEATSLTKNGYEVHIVALMKPNLETEETIDGVTIHRVKPAFVRLWCICRVLPMLLFPIGAIPNIAVHKGGGNKSTVRNLIGCIRSIFVGFFRWIGIVLFFLFIVPVWGFARLLVFVFNIKGYKSNGRKLMLVRLVSQKSVGELKHEVVPALLMMIRITRMYRLLLRMYRLLLGTLPYSFRIHSINFDLCDRALLLKPDIIQSHDCNTILGGAMIKKKLSIPLVYDSHELYLERNIGERSRWWDKKQWSPIEKKCIKKCDVVMTVSQGIVEHLNTQYGRDDVVLVRNVQPYHEPPKRNNLLRTELGIPDGKKIGLYIGAITFNRGVEELIEAAVNLTNCAIVIMGPAINPDYVDELKAQAKKLGVLNTTVFFRGPVESSRVLEYVASADIGVVPTQACCLSYEFESSNKIFHCVMAGVPLAMSNHIEKRNLQETYGIGALFDETNPKDIAKVIDDFVIDETQMENCANNCLVAAKELCWENEEKRLQLAFLSINSNKQLNTADYNTANRKKSTKRD
ncbi:MAG: glycosyltransferase [Phycisphaerae bacterium]|jgi:glycosyltransferase involved in cell wall biosynthesis|nr:glycosyltransferase [Phycisphaerae bacterium]